jgi:hypothetical protein
MKYSTATGLMRRAKRVEADGHTFDSQIEAKRYGQLKILAAAGDIIELGIHPTYKLTIKSEAVGTYTADFSYLEIERTRSGGEIRRFVIEDVKPSNKSARGYFLTRDSALRIKVFEAIYGRSVTIVAM